MRTPRPTALDAAFSGCVDALREAGYAHLLGVGLAVGDEVRLGGPAVDRPSNAFSITKAVVGMGVRKALRAGVLSSVDDPVGVTRSDCPPTVGSLLGMTQSWRAEPDMDELELRPDDPLPDIEQALACGTGPGRYVNAGFHLLIRDLDRRTGSAREFLHDAVLATAGAFDYEWEADPTGTPWGHAHLQLSVRDLLRLGMSWRDRGLVPERPVVPVTGPMPPESLPYAGGLWVGEGYVLAAGWGGQCLIIAPAVEAVFAALGHTGWDRSTNSDTLPLGWRSGRELFEKHALPHLVP